MRYIKNTSYINFMKFYIVDAFTDKAFGGNTAGVIILEQNDDFPPADVMKQIAAELRYSETVFLRPLIPIVDVNTSCSGCSGCGNVDSLPNKSFHARYFTPTDEVDLCGHATIGAFKALQDSGLVDAGIYDLETLAGDVKILIEGGEIMMDMATPKHISTIETKEELKELYNIMGVDMPLSSSICNLKPMIISTGLPDIMLPVLDNDSLNSLAPDMTFLSNLSKKYSVTGVHAFTMDFKKLNMENQRLNHLDLNCRNFAPLYGINEEAATGTANGALTYYLYLNKIIDSPAILTIKQGEAMNRPSNISSSIFVDLNTPHIRVGGKAVILAKGEFQL